MAEEKYIRWLSESGLKDMPLIGGRAARLGELYRARFPVPAGFVVTVKAFNAFLEQKKQGDYIAATIRAAQYGSVDDAAAAITNALAALPLPSAVEASIREAHDVLDIDEKSVSRKAVNPLQVLQRPSLPKFFAVRSSLRDDDSSLSSAAFLNVSGVDAVLAAVRECYISLFNRLTIHELLTRDSMPNMAVIVQQMVDAASSGVAFPASRKNDASLRIRAVWGLGEVLNDTMLTPDRYLVGKEHDILTIKDIQRGMQTHAIIRTASGKQEKVPLSEKRMQEQVLTSPEMREVASLATKVSSYLEMPCGLSFAFTEGKVSIVDVKPLPLFPLENEAAETTSDEKPAKESTAARSEDDIETIMLKELE